MAPTGGPQPCGDLRCADGPLLAFDREGQRPEAPKRKLLSPVLARPGPRGVTQPFSKRPSNRGLVTRPPQVAGEFATEPPQSTGSFRDFLRWRRERRRRIRNLQARGEKLPTVHAKAGNDLRHMPDSVTWVGHATVISRLGGQTIVSDPVWSRRVAYVVKRLTPAAPAWEAVPTPKFVTISHNHYDHMDAATLRRLRKTATVLVPKGDGDWFRRRRFPRVHEMDWWRTLDLDGVAFTFVPAKHFSGRGLRDRNKSLYGGWVIQDRNRTVYHVGDSGYFDGFREIGDRFPKIDVACLPVGAYEPRWFMAPFHVNPEEAGQAFLDTRAQKFLPIHWGTFRLSDEPMDEPPVRVARFFEERKIAPERFLNPSLGETLAL